MDSAGCVRQTSYFGESNGGAYLEQCLCYSLGVAAIRGTNEYAHCTPTPASPRCHRTVHEDTPLYLVRCRPLTDAPLYRLNRSHSPDISPVDEEDGFYPMSESENGRNGQSRSNIPMMRRERRQHQDATARNLRETKSRERLRQQAPETQDPHHPDDVLSRRGYKGGEVRWDPNTGELTSSEKGRPSQVKPADYAKGLGISENSPPPAQPTRQEATRSAGTFGERLWNMAKSGLADKNQEPEPLHALHSTTDPAAGAFVSDRPAWHGASGRTTLVAPVHDTKDVAPLTNIPRKSSRRAVTSKALAGTSTLDTIMASPPVSPPPGGETLGRETIRRIVPSSQLPKQLSQQPQAYPSPPLSGDIHENSRRDPPQPASNITTTTTTTTSPIHQIPRKPTHQQQGSDPFNYNNYTATAGPPQPPPHLEWTQPPSRFSVTTYDATPRESLDEFDPRDAPPVPETPDMFRHSPSQGDDATGRQRPRLLDHVGPVEPIVISLKESWRVNPKKKNGSKSGSGRARAADQDPATRPGSLHKLLPPAPPETSAKDRITQLTAQLAGLAQRRVNISRSIKQMTELMPTANILASAEVIHRRDMEKRKVDGLRAELSEVQREEYELGLKLHRAYKRVDRDAEFEPTTLWVRRVTG